jgi:hypothetical protein
VQAARQRIAEQYAGVSVGWRRAWAAALQELLPETA